MPLLVVWVLSLIIQEMQINWHTVYIGEIITKKLSIVYIVPYYLRVVWYLGGSLFGVVNCWQIFLTLLRKPKSVY